MRSADRLRVAGDAPGFRVTIAAAGSAPLTSHLVVPDDDTDGIRISTADLGSRISDVVVYGNVGDGVIGGANVGGNSCNGLLN